MKLKCAFGAICPDGEPLPLWARVIAGGASNATCWAVVYPVDVCRTYQQSEPAGTATRPRGLIASARALVAEGGVARLYRGIGFTLLRAGPVSGVILPLFDIVLAALEQRKAKKKASLQTAP